MENSVPLEIFGSRENRLDVGKRFVLLQSDLQKSQAHEVGRTVITICRRVIKVQNKSEMLKQRRKIN